MNSIIIECQHKNLRDIYQLTKSGITNINDAIALKNFQFLMENFELDMLKEFIEKTNNNMVEHDKKLTILIETNKIESEKKFSMFIEFFSNSNTKNIDLVIEITSKEIRKKAEIIKNIIENFSKNHIKIYIKNIDIINAPIIIGKAGIYTFNELEWEKYKENVEEQPLIVCGQNSLLIDVEKFKKYFKTKHELKTIMIASCKELLMISKIQRKNYQEYLKNLQEDIKLNKAAFNLATNYIRFWNYNWNDENKELILGILSNCKEIVQEFSSTEETIFKSCGVPLRFKVLFSSGFRKFDKLTLSERKYKKMTIKNIDEFNLADFQKFISFRERMNEIFDNCDRVRFFLSENMNRDDIFHQITYILNSYKIGFFCFDFNKRKEIIKLTDYL
ncbi:MAG: hypothetical protein QXG00_02250 [Candidatus Woesearchaeota archaeon]